MEKGIGFSPLCPTLKGKEVIYMSIMQEYESIRKRIGEKKYNQIEMFLEVHPHYYLIDVYYRKSVWDEMEKWVEENMEEQP